MTSLRIAYAYRVYVRRTQTHIPVTISLIDGEGQPRVARGNRSGTRQLQSAMARGMCKEENCSKWAQGGGFCIPHGGGRICEHEGCTKSAVNRTRHCGVHGERCKEEGCSKVAHAEGYCVPHGGGRRCQHEGCSKSAVAGGTQHCRPHGGGKRCQHEACSKASVEGGTQHCIAHGGGKRCLEEVRSTPASNPANTLRTTCCFRLLTGCGLFCRVAGRRRLATAALSTAGRMGEALVVATRAAPRALKAARTSA